MELEGTGGSLAKIGTGTLTLTGANTYTGATSVSSGVLEVSNITGSATGTGPADVHRAGRGGTGTIAGTVTVGTGNSTGAFLQPSVGGNKPATLTIQSTLTLNAAATYSYKLNSRQLSGDSVVAIGVTIASAAEFDMTVVGNADTVFTAINNTSATPIVGEFANLPNGSTFVLARNKFQVDYQGGDGNDLTLTVVP